MIPVGAMAEDVRWALQDFEVQPGLEGPQAICTWTPPAVGEIIRLKIVRKQGEYPRAHDDGVVLLDTIGNLATQSALVDTGDDLLDSDDGLGGAWWYYRAFVKPRAPATEDRFGGRGKQTISFPDVKVTTPVDFQDFDRFRIKVEFNDADAVEGSPIDFVLETAPTLGGPWVVLDTQSVAEGDHYIWEYDGASFKYIRIRPLAEVDEAVVWILAPWFPEWTTLWTMDAPCLVYSTGRMADLINRFCIPFVYRVMDLQQPSARLQEATIDDEGQLASIGVESETAYPFERFLRVFAAELDRVWAFTQEIGDHHSDLAEAPEGLLRLLSYELGWTLDLGQDLEAARAEVDSVPSIWKRKGTTRLFQDLAQQILGIVPRVQEGEGLVARFLNPDLIVGE